MEEIGNTFLLFTAIRRRPPVHVVERQEECGRHGPKRAHRYPARRAGRHPPRQVGVDHDGFRLPLQHQLVEEPPDGVAHLGVHGLDEADRVCAAAVLGGEDVEDGGEADALRQRGDHPRGGQQRVPLLRDDDGHGEGAGGKRRAWG
jgi:hypothetical protein